MNGIQHPCRPHPSSLTGDIPYRTSCSDYHLTSMRWENLNEQSLSLGPPSPLWVEPMAGYTSRASVNDTHIMSCHVMLCSAALYYDVCPLQLQPGRSQQNNQTASNHGLNTDARTPRPTASIKQTLVSRFPKQYSKASSSRASWSWYWGWAGLDCGRRLISNFQRGVAGQARTGKAAQRLNSSDINYLEQLLNVAKCRTLKPQLL